MLNNLEKCDQSQLIIKKSEFLGFAIPVTSADQVQMFHNNLRQYHKNAKHICYAFSFFENGVLKEKYFDDAEPKGTAGKPILDIIKKKNIKNCCVFVVRYFGGVLLGVGGLTRAYRKCAILALENLKG